jgi:opacity protein-like surface antigen
MYKFLKKTGILLAMGIIVLSTAQAASWDEDNAPPAGSVVTSDGSNDQDYGQGITLKSNTGYNGGITFGYDYKWFRIEEELNAARNGADTVNISGFPAINVNGNTTSYSAMTNAIFNLRCDTGFGVFAGVGLGGSAIDYDYQSAQSGVNNNSTWKGAFTAQALGGVSYAFNHTVELDLEYRYVDAFVSDNNIPDYQTNNVDLGLKFFLT